MKGFRRYLFGGTLVIIAYLVAQYFKPVPTDWKPSYLAKDKIPFGTYILTQRIADLLPKTKVMATTKPIYNTLKERSAGTSNYLIIASTVKINKLDFQEMERYMKAGNNIFLAAFQIEGMLMDTLKSDIYSEFNLRMKRRYPINFVNPALKREYGYYFDKEVGGQYFDRLDTARAIVLGQKSSSKANFVQYKFGKGALFILPNPQLFTNYCLLKDDGMDYAAKALSYLPQADQLIWDEHFTRNDVQDKSMLRVFFDNDRLRWAYNLALWGLVIFVLYEMKRRQRIIPVIAHLKNTSVDFVKVVGRVYYQQRNHQDIVAKKITYFWAYIRRKYKLKTTEVNQELMDRLIHVSSASPEVIETLFSAIISFNQGEKISDKQLISLNTLIEKFYEQDQ